MAKKLTDNVELIVYCEGCRKKCWDPSSNYVPIFVAERSGRKTHVPLSFEADLMMEKDRQNCSFQLLHSCNKKIGEDSSSHGDKRLEEQRNMQWGPSNWKKNWTQCSCYAKRN